VAVGCAEPAGQEDGRAGRAGGSGFYLLISGQAIATQRAFIMLAVMFVAVLAGRSALSMRNLAIAAFIVLLVAPEAALSASFQMSFLAVTGLIAAYEAAAGWQSRFTSGLMREGRLHSLPCGC
jgi:competence protein ComEC